jgi:hypothetical protein
MSQEGKDPARIYREAAGAYLGGPRVEAAGIFSRPDEDWKDWLSGSEVEGIASLFAWLYEMASQWGRLRGSFLLAVTEDEVYALKYSDDENFRVTEEIGSFGRDEVWLRSYAGGEVIYFESRRHQIDLDGAAVKDDPGAAEVFAALSE